MSELSLSVKDLRVIVRIDGEAVGSLDGSAGPDPWFVLVPVNRFVATVEPTTATIACCRGCGPDCSAVEARIQREGAVVRWVWGDREQRGESGRRTTLFDAGAYDAEVSRLGADFGWETPLRRAGRLILSDLPLPPGLVGDRVCGGGSGRLEVWFTEPDEYQVFVTFPWDEARPDESAAEIRAVLAGPVALWPARWHSIRGDRDEPPAYAGPAWQRAVL